MADLRRFWQCESLAAITNLIAQSSVELESEKAPIFGIRTFVQVVCGPRHENINCHIKITCDALTATTLSTTTTTTATTIFFVFSADGVRTCVIIFFSYSKHIYLLICLHCGSHFPVVFFRRIFSHGFRVLIILSRIELNTKFKQFSCEHNS